MREGPAALFPPSLDSYGSAEGSLLETLSARMASEPMNLIATGVFCLAILHTFAASWFLQLAHRAQQHHDARAAARGLTPAPSVLAETLHFLGEVEVVFGLWAIPLMLAVTASHGWHAAQQYLNDTVVYTEAMFVVVVMALAASRPVVVFAEAALQRTASLAGAATPRIWWTTILTVGPLLGSFITEPAAMTICAVLLSRQFFDLAPPMRLRYATLGLLFVNVSIGGTLTHFAAPPVLMVARPWNWTMSFMAAQFGWKAAIAIAVSTALVSWWYRRDLAELDARLPIADRDPADEAAAAADQPLPAPWWVTATHLAFIAWVVLNAHYPAIFVASFLFFLGFARATAAYQSRIELRTPLLVGFFLAGLVIHGGLQGWWIAPVLASLSELPLFLGAGALTAFNDNALITYLATLVPDLDEPLRIAVVQGAVVGGGLTVIANAPNPAGQAILARFFDGAVSPRRLVTAAALPTAVAALVFRLF